MGHSALAYSSRRQHPRRARLLRQHAPRSTRELRPWTEVAVAGTTLHATSGHPTHIKRAQFIALIAAAIAVHIGGGWFLNSISSQPVVKPPKQELNIELVRPPKPPEPPKVEPPKPPPPKPKVQPQVLPEIQQAVVEPAAVGVSDIPPVAAAPVVSEPPPPLPVSAPVGRAGYLNNPEPKYPPQAVRQGWEGTVLLRVRVLANGSVESIEIRKSSGRKILDDEAVFTVKSWTFTPSKRGDAAIDGWATVPIEFSLDQ